jgi:hypothetical protein
MRSAEEKQKQGVGVFETDVVVIGQIPKNNTVEQRVTFKRVAAGHKNKPEPFVDVREYWFRDGPLEPPIPTGKGVMIKRADVPELVRMLILGLDDSEIDEAMTAKIKAAIDRKGRT